MNSVQRQIQGSSALTEAKTSGLWLISIGANGFQSSSPTRTLAFAESDATHFHTAMVSQQAYEIRSSVLMASQVYSRDAESVIQDVTSSAHEDDDVIIYFAGHGIIEKDGIDLELFLGVHGTQMLDLRNTAIALNRLIADIEQSRAGTCLLLLDCCFSGNARGRSTAGPRYLADLKKGRRFIRRLPAIDGDGRLLIGAAAKDSYAHESATVNAGIFTHCLLRILYDHRHYKVIPIAMFYAQLQQAMNRKTSGRQLPVLSGDDSGAVIPTILSRGIPER